MTKLEQNPGYPWQESAPGTVQIHGGFWGERLDVAARVTVPHVLDRLEEEGRGRNFDRAAGLLEGGFEGHYRFDDSDVYKALEGVAYLLAAFANPALEARADKLIARIARAQMTDGYLYTWYQLGDLDARFTDMDSHEMYCGGHLMEAAAAYREATGKTELLNVARRLADHYLETFGPGRRHWVDGHEEVGLGLLALYRVTGDARYRDFAHWHLEERGHGHGRGAIWDRPDFGARYAQDHVPVREIRAAEGHAVRAMYLYAAMTDLVAQGVAPEYQPALLRAFENIVAHKMYVTGGIGAVGRYEGFGPDDYLPNREAYCESCAAIGMVYWNHRMNLLTGDARYADIVEQELLNGVLAGLSLGGDRFFYVNPLGSDGDHHREPWFACACCPSNFARFMPGIPRYFQALTADGLVVNQFASGETVHRWRGRRLSVLEETRYPYEGAVTLTIYPEAPEDLTLRIRKPGWTRSARIELNGRAVAPGLDRGYFVVRTTFAPGDRVTLSLDIEPRRVHAAPAVEEDRGRVALASGPLVFCAERADNPGGDWSVSPSDQIRREWDPNLLGGMPVLRVTREHRDPLTLVPYFAWDNRSPGRMDVWLPEACAGPLPKGT